MLAAMLLLTLLLSCGSAPDAPAPEDPAPVAPAPAPGAPARGTPRGPPLGPDGQPMTSPGPNGPPGGPPGVTGPAGAPGASGVMLQDPSGFPPFHDQPAPPGPPITEHGDWTEPVKLSVEPGGGYRPQIAVSPTGELHAVFYERDDSGDLIRHRHRPVAGGEWSAPLHVGFEEGRNWGPDIVARPDGSLVVVFDHMAPDMTSRGFLTTWTGERWSTPQPLTADDGGEIGSGHVAHGPGDELAYVWIGKPLDPQAHFRARWRWFRDGAWSDLQDFTDGSQDAWHTNVERRPDGSVLAGWDVGQGGSATTLFVADGRDGRFSTPENLSATGEPGERPHFAFAADGTDTVAWFHKEAGRPLAVFLRSGRPGAWGPVVEPSKGYGGYHFDPDVAVNADGVRCLVWGWDSGADAELVYSVDKGQGWSPPRKVADIDWGKPGLPSIDVDAAGAFHVVWNQGVRGDNDVFYSKLVVD